MIIIDDILSKLAVYLINRFKVQRGDFSYFRKFDYWQTNGFSIIPNHYYQPIPDLSLINKKTIKSYSEMIGIDINENQQIKLLVKLNKYKKYFTQFKEVNKDIDVQQDIDFYFNNLAFDGVDALLYYAIIKHLKPKTIVEVGSGWSTKIAATACRENSYSELISIEPYPQPILVKGFNGLTKLIEKKIEDVPSEYFEILKSGDILFIDSSHTVKYGGDVNCLFFEVLPRLNKGVYVHIHDIFLPFDYPYEWITQEYRFWTEQYLLQAFLMFNSTFEIIYSNSYMGAKHIKEVKQVFSNSPFFKGGSIWLQKKK